MTKGGMDKREYDLEKVIQAVKDGADIVELIGENVALRGGGANLIGLCPFHNDERPSMYVSPSKQIFKCFSCSAGGDVIKYIQLRDGLEFQPALEFLAKRYDVPFRSHTETSGEKETRQTKSRMLEINRLAARFFMGNYLDSPAHNYLEKRGILDETATDFSLGYAPDSWNSLSTHLNYHGASSEEAEQAGLVIKSQREDGSSYDIFRNRVMFPIFDPHGDIIGFGGRTLNDDVPKYLNTSVTPLFVKRKVFYGLDRATRAISRTGQAIIVEGYTDVIMAHQSGLENVIATIGTALTPEHAQLLAARFPKARVVLLYDGDDGGKRGAIEAGKRLLPKLLTHVAHLPSEKDPARIIEEGGDLGPYLGESTEFLEFYLNFMFPKEESEEKAEQKKDLFTFSSRRKALQEIHDDLWEQIPANEKPLFLNSLAGKLNLTTKEISEFFSGRQNVSQSRNTLYWEERLLGEIVGASNRTIQHLNELGVSPELFSTHETRAVCATILAIGPQLGPDTWPDGTMFGGQFLSYDSLVEETYYHVKDIRDIRPDREKLESLIERMRRHEDPTKKLDEIIYTLFNLTAVRAGENLRTAARKLMSHGKSPADLARKLSPQAIEAFLSQNGNLQNGDTAIQREE